GLRRPPRRRPVGRPAAAARDRAGTARKARHPDPRRAVTRPRAGGRAGGVGGACGDQPPGRHDPARGAARADHRVVLLAHVRDEQRADPDDADARRRRQHRAHGQRLLRLVTALQYIVDGIALGAVYALVAVGLALVFGVMGLVIFRRLRYATPATALVTTFAVAFALEAVWLIAFGPQGKSADVLSSLNRTATHGSLHIRWVTITMVAVGALLMAGTGLLLNRTRIGLEMRAAAADFRAARLLGVRANRVIGTAFLLGGLFAGVGALQLTATQPLVTPTFGLQITILALVGVVVGGMDRLVSATLGGFAIGFVNSLLG